MIVTLVHVWVKEENLDEFLNITRWNHEQSVQEEGNLRFDVLQDAKDKTKFTLYEAYATEAAAKAHKSTPHYLKWRETVADWMAKPREGVKHNILFPEDILLWKTT